MNGEGEEEFAYPELQLKKEELEQLQSLMDAIEKGTPLEEWRAPRGWLFYSRSHSGKGDTPFTWAARHGNAEAVAWLIDKYTGGPAEEGWLDEHLPGEGLAGSGLEYTTRTGAGPLMIACTHGHTECARLLLEAGAAVGTANSHGRTPLSAAIKHGHIECARLLVNAGAAVGATSSNGITPLLTAVKYGHIECARLLLTAGAPVDMPFDSHTALFAACNNGLTECARLLLESGAAVDQATTHSGTTPLFAASRYGHVGCVRLLLGAGAAVETGRTGGTSTPLDAAVKHNHVECARLLLEAGATVDTAKANGRTSMFTAVRWCYIDCVKLLSSYGACRVVQRGPSISMTAEAVSTHFHPQGTLTEWLVLSRHWAPLHHLETLTLERARAFAARRCRRAPQAGRRRADAPRARAGAPPLLRCLVARRARGGVLVGRIARALPRREARASRAARTLAVPRVLAADGQRRLAGSGLYAVHPAVPDLPLTMT